MVFRPSFKCFENEKINFIKAFLKLESLLFQNMFIGNNANVQHFFLQSIINIVIQVIFPNIITYLDRPFKKEQNGLNFKIKKVY